MTAFRRFTLRLLSFFRLNRAEADLAREINAHLQLLEDEFVAKGMARGDARLAARRAFGGVEQAKEQQRDARGFRWLENSRIDFKLGARMLRKYPGLSLIGGAGLAVGIAIGTAFFAFFYAYIYATIPAPDGHRIVGLENWDIKTNNEMRQSAHDFVTWRDDLKTVEELGAFRTIGRNLVVAGASPEPVRIAEITAAGLSVPHIQPRLGRLLTAADESPGAAPVLVIGSDVWVTRFNGDQSIIGRDRASRQRRPHHRGGDARGIRISDQSQLLDTAPPRAVGVSAPAGSRDLHLRATRARRHHRSGAGGVDDAGGEGVGAVSRYARRPARARDAVRASDPRHPGDHLVAVRADAVHGQPAAGGRRAQCRDPDLRADGDATGRDRGEDGARRQPAEAGRATFHRGAFALRPLGRRRHLPGEGRHSHGPRHHGDGGRPASLLHRQRHPDARLHLRCAPDSRRRGDRRRRARAARHGAAHADDAEGVRQQQRTAPRRDVDDVDRRAGRAGGGRPADCGRVVLGRDQLCGDDADLRERAVPVGAAHRRSGAAARHGSRHLPPRHRVAVDQAAQRSRRPPRSGAGGRGRDGRPRHPGR